MPFSSEHAEATFRALEEFAPDAMVFTDRDGRIVLVNAQAERLFGYKRDELIGQDVEMLVPSRFSTHAMHRRAYVDNPSHRPMGSGLRLFARRKDGTEVPVEVSLGPISTESTQLVAAAVRDVSDRYRTEQLLAESNERLAEANAQLAQANRIKDSFLATMSHELRTPLNAITGFTSTLLMKLTGPLTNDQEDQLRVIQRSAAHMLSLINDLLDIAKIESGKTELHADAVNLRALFESVVDGMRGLARDKGLSLDANVPDANKTIVTDERSLRQILINLVTNGIKYTDRGFVRLELQQPLDDGAPMGFAVIDSGRGIPQSDVARLFERFERLADSDRGTGLGLYLSAKLAELLGGSLECASEVGTGSIFTLRIPKRLPAVSTV